MLLNTFLWLFELFGRLHPMIVHFPIALILVIAFLELWGIIKKVDFSRTISVLVVLTAISAVISAAFGYALMSNESYSGELMDSHYYSGIVTAILAIILLLVDATAPKEKASRNGFRFFVVLSCVSVTVAGHFGAELTHGEDYLLEVFVEETDQAELTSLITEVNSTTEVNELQLERLSMEAKAIIAHNCYQCHNENKVKGGLVLDNKEGVFKGGESGPVIVKGSAAESELFRRISLDKNHDDIMPKKGKKLPLAEIKLIKTWIDKGAYYSDVAVDVFPEAELALNKPKLPKSSKFDNPVDKLVEKYFEENDVEFKEVVDDEVYIRRVYLDILGLLPTPDQINQFKRESNPSKRSTVVDSLLNRREDFTIHWLSFWNDLLRNDYSGTGYITGGRRQISSWLYNSIYENKSYDSMVIQLINPTPESDGFIKGIKWRGVVNSSQTTEMQAAQNIGQSLLGVNVKCASCHNSFVSNLKLDEVYAFANIFSDSTLEIARCDKPTGRMAGTAFIYPELGEITGNTIQERLASLSTVMVNPDNGRLYRTFVNRIWGRFMGRGIVERYDEMDNKPWDSALLDYLAAEFRDSGTDINGLIKMIATSNAYQMPTVTYSKVEEIKTDKYVFEGPIPRRLTAEQFTDAVSQAIEPVYSALAFNPYGIQNPGNWIWKREIEFDRDVQPLPGKVYFRYNFEVETEDVEAEYMITADDSYILYINGELAGADGNWTTVEKGQIRLKKGVNSIAVEGENRGLIAKPSGLLFALRYKNQAGEEQRVISDGNWKVTKELNKGWLETEFDFTEWENARGQNRGHWGTLPEFTFEESWEKPFIRASLVKLDPFLKSLGRPTREIVMTTRDENASLLQTLQLTNSQLLYDLIEKGAKEYVESGAGNDKVINDLFVSLLGRLPNSDEKDVIEDSIEGENKVQDLTDVIWAMLMLPEFQYIN